MIIKSLLPSSHPTADHRTSVDTRLANELKSVSAESASTLAQYLSKPVSRQTRQIESDLKIKKRKKPISILTPLTNALSSESPQARSHRQEMVSPKSVVNQVLAAARDELTESTLMVAGTPKQMNIMYYLRKAEYARAQSEQFMLSLKKRQ